MLSVLVLYSMKSLQNMAMALLVAVGGVTELHGGKKLNGFEIIEPLVPEKEIRRGGPGRAGPHHREHQYTWHLPMMTHAAGS